MNAISIISKKANRFSYQVYTTSNRATSITFQSPADNVRIKRTGWSGPRVGRLPLLLTYVWFNLKLLWDLFLHRPGHVIYYETISGFAPLIYKKYINKASRIFVHYHEYVSPREYAEGMKQTRMVHQMEQKAYPQFTWISQTNESRLELLLKDQQNPGLKNLHVLPNYPPSSWKQQSRTEAIHPSPLKIVYTGSVGLSSMYFEEFARFVQSQQGKITWDIYSYNAPEDALKMIESLNCEFIRVLPAVDYYQLPSVLRDYHVGVILYKGHGLNWIYNIPNKLFEYHVCGLDVWYPKEMRSPASVKTTDSYPQILEIDFMNLAELKPQDLFNRSNKRHLQLDFEAEKVLQQLVNELEIDKK